MRARVRRSTPSAIVSPSVILHVSSAAGNVFGYLWADIHKSFNMEELCLSLCPRGRGFGLDGLFLMQRPGSGPWVIDHWEPDGTKTFCSNGSRAALAIPGAPGEADITMVSSGVAITLNRREGGVGIRMPQGESCHLQAAPGSIPHPGAFAWIGNPQLVLRVPRVDAIHLPTFAPPLRHHPEIPGGVNVNVVEVLAPGEARIRSWERGVEGETLCCGTGCAVAAAWLAQTEGPRTWRLHTASGETVTVHLELETGGRWRDMWLTGAVRYLGQVHPDPLLLQGLQG